VLLHEATVARGKHPRAALGYRSRMRTDQTLPLMADGYLHLTRLRERARRDVVPTRVLGRRAVVVAGVDAAAVFYDGGRFDRQGVLPPTVPQTLFGHGAVHLLDGDAHRRRKALFTTALADGAATGLAEAVSAEWDARARTWTGREITVFDEAAEVLCRAVHRWAGVPLPDRESAAVARDLVAMVDGFGSVGARYLRARSARRRQERRVARVLQGVRDGDAPATSGSALDLVARHRDRDGDRLPLPVASVELLNLLRPTVAVTWFVTFGLHAMIHRLALREWVRAGGRDRAEAFAHEVRRFYPMAPFLAARAIGPQSIEGVRLETGDLAVLDIFGHHHDANVWPDPWTFAPVRHLERTPGPFEILAQGGGDIATGHRCPGEPAVVDILTDLVPRLAALTVEVPAQDLRVTRHRLPARVRSDLVVRVG